jgi:hypothetical protein
MPRLAVVTAPNPGHDNPGMLTVDLALHAFLRRLDPGLEVGWYVLVPPDADRFADIGAASAPVIQRFHETVDSTEAALARALRELLVPSAE